VCRDLAVRGSPAESLRDGFGRKFGCFAESRSIARLDLEGESYRLCPVQ
jgi:hypothetical protein